jgi:hypothetical protein
MAHTLLVYWICCASNKEVDMAHHTNNWNDFRDRYRKDWETSYPNRDWNQVEHGYRYGWESAQDSRWSGRSSFAEVESDLRQGWGTYDRSMHQPSAGTQMEHAWEDFKDSVRHGWERAKQEFRERT